MSTLWMVLFVTAAVYLFGAAGYYGFKQRQEFKRGMKDIERIVNHEE